jgi:hypothetical protein
VQNEPEGKRGTDKVDQPTVHPLFEAYRTFGLNFYTTTFFLAPAIQGLVSNCPQVSAGSFACLVTGFLNHATYQKHLAIIDRVVVAFCVIYFAIRCATWTWYYFGTIVCVVVLIIGFKFFSFREDPYGVIFHSFLHFASNLGVCLMISGCVQKACPLFTGETHLGSNSTFL